MNEFFSLLFLNVDSHQKKLSQKEEEARLEFPRKRSPHVGIIIIEKVFHATK